VEHSEDGGFVGGELVDILVDPEELFGLFVLLERFVSVGLEEEADVVVVVCFFFGGVGNGVDVDVEDGGEEGADEGEARFFAGFFEGDGERVGVAVGVAAELEPFVQFCVVGEERLGSILIEKPSGGSDMSDRERSLEAVGVGLNEIEDSDFVLFFFVVEGLIVLEQLDEGVSVHFSFFDFIIHQIC
jgi:hypothetical protein